MHVQLNYPPASADGRWTTTAFAGWDFPDSVVRSWDALARQYGDTGVFLESGWFDLWRSTIGRNYDVFVVVVEHAGEVQGIFPCGVAPGGRLQALAFDLPFDFLVAPDNAARTIDCFLGVLRTAGTDGAYFHDIPSSSRVAPLLYRGLRARHLPVGPYSRPAAPYVDLETRTWSDYDGSLHPKLRNNIRKGLRRAAQEGVLSFHMIERATSLDRLMDEVLAVEFRSWKGEHGTAIQCDPHNERFYRAIAAREMRRGRLRIFALRLNDRMIAFDLCVASGRTVFAIKTGYDQNLAARLSPGNLMRHRLLEHLFQTREFARYDFLGPAYPWKLEWTSLTDTWTSFEIYPPTISGWCAYLQKYGWKQPLKRSHRLAAFLKRISK